MQRHEHSDTYWSKGSSTHDPEVGRDEDDEGREEEMGEDNNARPAMKEPFPKSSVQVKEVVEPFFWNDDS